MVLPGGTQLRILSLFSQCAFHLFFPSEDVVGICPYLLGLSASLFPEHLISTAFQFTSHCDHQKLNPCFSIFPHVPIFPGNTASSSALTNSANFFSLVSHNPGPAGGLQCLPYCLYLTASRSFSCPLSPKLQL